MAENQTASTLLSIAREIRALLPEAVQEKYSIRDIHRTAAALLVKSGDVIRTETGLEPTAIGIDHGILEPEGEETSLRFSETGRRTVQKLFFKAYPAFAPLKLSDSVFEHFKSTGRVVPSFEYNGKTIRYENEAWMMGTVQLPRERIAWAEKQFSQLFFRQGAGVSILTDIGDQFRTEGPKRVASYFYEEAVSKADTGRRKQLLPKLASTYRQIHMPLRAIKLYEDMDEEERKVFCTVPFLTVVASAYCDINNYIAARELADLALQISNGRQSADLSTLYRKIRTGNGVGK